jgi:phosphate starvation-inducible PhoH-like protein
MKMFLTRLGFNSKMIITGDITQIDLPRGVPSGLQRAMHILQNVKGIEFVRLTAMDVVRHPVVQRIIERYEGEEHMQ